MIECGDWLGRIMKRLPVMQPGTLVASSEGIGVFLGNWGGNDRIYGVMRGDRTLLEIYPG